MTEKHRIIMYDKIKQHGENLRKIFSFSPAVDMVSICKKLFTLETKTNKIMIDYRNGLLSSDTADYVEEKTLNTLFRILNIAHSSPIANSIIINCDPSGYSLKINTDLPIYRDMGGYGILAPDFRIY